jgi:ABC-2 type transport system ATP-binding protein
MTAEAMLVDGVGRRFGAGEAAFDALRDVSFAVRPGEVVALLGRNGAGKTTLVKILSTLLLPSTGRALVGGHDVVREVRAARSVTGVVFGGERGLYARLSGRDNLRFLGMLAGVGRRGLRERIPQVLDHVNLAAAADRRVETYSKGMRQRLHLAVGLLARPRVLLLDEPTVGLDPIEADRLRSAVADLRRQGVAVLLTSHLLVDVERLADRVLLLSAGRITRDLTLAEFKQAGGHAADVVVRGAGRPPALDGVRPPWALAFSMRPVPPGWEATLRLREWTPEVFAAFAALFAGAEVHDVDVREQRLEDAFRRLSREVPA